MLVTSKLINMNEFIIIIIHFNPFNFGASPNQGMDP